MNARSQLAVETLPSGRPEYFERIRRRAAERWDQLEADPELAGPWHQLFKQVQSPRHILSELLQNADDAGASEAQVSIESDRFIFEHNGDDFIEAHFQLLHQGQFLADGNFGERTLGNGGAVEAQTVDVFKRTTGLPLFGRCQVKRFPT